MDESAAECYRSGSDMLFSADGSNAEFAPRPRQMPPILGEIVASIGCNASFLPATLRCHYDLSP
jgi:hypothetical protein